MQDYIHRNLIKVLPLIFFGLHIDIDICFQKEKKWSQNLCYLHAYGDVTKLWILDVSVKFIYTNNNPINPYNN